MPRKPRQSGNTGPDTQDLGEADGLIDPSTGLVPGQGPVFPTPEVVTSSSAYDRHLTAAGMQLPTQPASLQSNMFDYNAQQLQQQQHHQQQETPHQHQLQSVFDLSAAHSIPNLSYLYHQ